MSAEGFDDITPPTTEKRALAAGAAQAHDSAYKHTSGQAQYVDDIATPTDCVHVFIAHSPVAHGRILKTKF